MRVLFILRTSFLKSRLWELHLHACVGDASVHAAGLRRLFGPIELKLVVHGRLSCTDFSCHGHSQVTLLRFTNKLCLCSSELGFSQLECLLLSTMLEAKFSHLIIVLAQLFSKQN